MDAQTRIEMDAMRWRLGIIPDDEVAEVRARLEAAGRVLDGDRWRERPRERRPDPQPIAGEIVVGMRAGGGG